MIGSRKLDLFKRRHKDINSQFYASDGDLFLVEKYPPGIMACLDYKVPGDRLTFSEGILYNQFIKDMPVFVVEGTDPEKGPFTIKRILGINWGPEPVEVFFDNKEEAVRDWQELEKWEQRLRNEYCKRGGWNGNLKCHGIINGIDE